MDCVKALVWSIELIVSDYCIKLDVTDSCFVYSFTVLKGREEILTDCNATPLRTSSPRTHLVDY